MSFAQMSVDAFSEALSGKAAVPGGGGAAALVGAAGAALGCMVAALTIGKPKYAAVEEEIAALAEKCKKLRRELVACIDKDTEVFEPLAKAYGLPKDDPQRAGIIEGALKGACAVPLEIMAKCCLAIECCREFADKGSQAVTAEAAMGALFCKAALEAASLNVFSNTCSMTDRVYAYETNKAAEGMLRKYIPIADETCSKVLAKLKTED